MSEPATTRRLPAGKIEVAPRALQSIAAATVTRCYGVVGMAPHTLREGVAQVLRQQDAHKGVEVRVRGGEVEIDLYIIVAYGTRIAEVARNAQEAVRYAIERAIGAPVARVNVRVQGLRTAEAT
jgi:uncharacterized alkaline shock family protein YloU